MRVLWAEGGVHSCLHYPRPRSVLWEMGVWAVRGGCEGRALQSREWQRNGGRPQGPHAILLQIQCQSRSKRRRCNAPDSASEVRVAWSAALQSEQL